MTNAIFTPKADDNFAAATEVPTEYGVVKSSGYIDEVRVGGYGLSVALQISKHSGGRTIVSRQLGTAEWTVVEQVEAPTDFEVPDALPEDFA